MLDQKKFKCLKCGLTYIVKGYNIGDWGRTPIDWNMDIMRCSCGRKLIIMTPSNEPITYEILRMPEGHIMRQVTP